MSKGYTEQSRRAIFFAGYEASHLGSQYIEAEHLLLGLLREDKALFSRLLPAYAGEPIRKLIEAHPSHHRRLSTSEDCPLSHRCKRALVYGAREARRLDRRFVGTADLLLGLLRDEESFASQILRERGLTLDSVREELQRSEG